MFLIRCFTVNEYYPHITKISTPHVYLGSSNVGFNSCLTFDTINYILLPGYFNIFLHTAYHVDSNPQGTLLLLNIVGILRPDDASFQPFAFCINLLFGARHDPDDPRIVRFVLQVNWTSSHPVNTLNDSIFLFSFITSFMNSTSTLLILRSSMSAILYAPCLWI